VWGAHSHMPIGSMQVDLRLLLRQGREAVQTAAEFAVHDTSLSTPPPQDSGGGGIRSSGGVRSSYEAAAASVVASRVSLRPHTLAA
jgi:hypothetical protein